MGRVPSEVIELELCELYHCRPSELEEEDGHKLLQHLSLQYWREAAHAFKDKDRRKQIPLSDRIAIHKLVSGQSDTLVSGEEEQSPIEKQLSKVKQFVDNVDQEGKSGNSKSNPKHHSKT